MRYRLGIRLGAGGGSVRHVIFVLVWLAPWRYMISVVVEISAQTEMIINYWII